MIGLVVGLIAVHHGVLVAPEATLMLVDRHGEFVGEVGGTDVTGFGYWPVEEVPQRYVVATLAIEDHRFFEHPGVDAKAVLRAAWQNLSSGERVSGASTLAMQVARMQRPGPRTYVRKLVEAATALVITHRYGRDAVLRHYLRLVPFGNQVHGVAYAARRYLDKPPEDLSWAEVAFLAAIPQSPARMNPFDRVGRRRAIERGVRILGLLRDNGALSAAEHELAERQIREIAIPSRRQRPDEAMHAIVRLQCLLGASDERRHGGVVRTTLDLELQRRASDEVLSSVVEWSGRGVRNAALVVVDHRTMEVLAWVGSTDYFDARHAGAIDYVRVPRSPGSTLKPFFYALALERGVITPATVLPDLARGAGGIGNADSAFLGPLLPRAALANSRNVPAADLLQRIGLDEGYAFLEELGLHEGLVPVRHWGLGLSIGNMPVTLEQLIRAYGVLAGDGRLRDLRWIRERRESERPTRILSERTARQVTRFLADREARLPTFPRMGHLEYPFPVAAKTGTSSGYHDAWTVAWSSRYMVGAWLGDPDFRGMNRVSGYRSAARLVKTVLSSLHDGELDGLEDAGFPPPRGRHAVRLCALSGQRATTACDRVVTEWFQAGVGPVERCEVHRRVAVDVRNGLLASAETPAEHVEVRTFAELDARFAAWQVAAGLEKAPTVVSDFGATGHRGLWTALPGTVPSFRAVRHSISITAPTPSLELLRDPEAPAGWSTLALRAVVEPAADQIVWYVDGQPFRVATYPYTARWPLQPGRHTFQARLPSGDARSPTVEVEVF